MSDDILGTSCDQCRSMVQKFGKNGISFSRPWKCVKTEWGLWKFVNFVVFRALGKNYQLISQKLHFPRPNSSLNKTKNGCAMSERMHFLSVLTDKVSAISSSKGCTPLLDVWKSCVPSCCFSMPYRNGLWKVCEFWKDFSVRTPWYCIEEGFRIYCHFTVCAYQCHWVWFVGGIDCDVHLLCHSECITVVIVIINCS